MTQREPRPTFAKGTTVRVQQTIGDIEQLLARYQASAFKSGWQEDPPIAAVEFDIDGMRFRYAIPLPTIADFEYTAGTQRTRRKRSTAQAQAALDQARRERWRALFLSIKGQLVAVDLGIRTLSEALIGEAVIYNAAGAPTVRDWLRPQLTQIADRHRLPPMLPGYTPPEE